MFGEPIDFSKVIEFKRTSGLTRLHILEAIMYVFGYEIKGTYEDVKNIDDMIVAIEHFRFLRKYKLN